MSDESVPEIYRGLSGHDVVDGIEAQLSTGNFVLPPVVSPSGQDRHFQTTTDFWQALFREGIRVGRTIVLDDVLLSEWFPRSPGLFHTEEAANWREYADQHVMVLTTEQQALYDASRPPNPRVFNLYGKIEMLRGGIGCVRLNRKLTSEGHLWFMSASTGPSADAGVPVALSDNAYTEHIEYLTEYGAMPCSLTGKLVVMPDSLLTLYRGYRGVPRIYVLVEEIQPKRSPIVLPDGPPVVNVAVMFESERSGFETISATYVDFVPGRRGTMAKRLPWLEYYVENLHDGAIITDFDEQMSHFPEAIFSLHKISSQSLQKSQLDRLSERVGWLHGAEAPFGSLIEQQQAIKVIVHNYQGGEIFMGDHITAGAGAIVVNRSQLENALNTVESAAGVDVAAALRELASAVELSADPRARDNFDGLTEELSKPNRNPNRVKVWLDAVVSALPNIGQAATAVAAISESISR